MADSTAILEGMGEQTSNNFITKTIKRFLGRPPKPAFEPNSTYSRFDTRGEGTTKWTTGTIEHPKQPAGGRTLLEYEQILGFSRKELTDAEVLDLGAGPEVKLASQLAEDGITAKVVSLSPDFFFKKFQQKAKEANKQAKIVAGLGQQLPFASETFDKVLCLHVFSHLASETVYNNLIKEVGRVLKKGGKAYLGPTVISEDLIDYYYKGIVDDQEMAQYLNNLHISVRREVIPEEYFTTGLYAVNNMRVGTIGGSRIILEKAGNLGSV